MENPLAPTSDDLEQAYRVRDPNMTGPQSAQAVVVGTDGITVLCDANVSAARAAFFPDEASGGSLRS